MFMFSNGVKLIMKLQKIKYGKNLQLMGNPLVFNFGGGGITLGDNVCIKSSFLSNLVGLYSRTIILTRTSDAEIYIGNNVGISGSVIYARKGITIGDNTCIGGNCKILDNDFHPIEAEARNEGNKEKIRSKEISIGNNCFIGCNCIVLKGSILGDGCVVGAGAVVSGVFEAGCVIAGNPAKVVRRL